MTASDLTPERRAALRAQLTQATPNTHVNIDDGKILHRETCLALLDALEASETKLTAQIANSEALNLVIYDRDAQLVETRTKLAHLAGPCDAHADLRDADARIADLEARVEAADRELERWRHGKQIEGDYVCHYALNQGIAEAVIDDLRARLAASEGAHRCHLGDCGYVCPKHRTVYLFTTPLPTTDGGPLRLVVCPEPGCGQFMLSLCALNQREAEADRDAARAEVERVRREFETYREQARIGVAKLNEKLDATHTGRCVHCGSTVPGIAEAHADALAARGETQAAHATVARMRAALAELLRCEIMDDGEPELDVARQRARAALTDDAGRKDDPNAPTG